MEKLRDILLLAAIAEAKKVIIHPHMKVRWIEPMLKFNFVPQQSDLEKLYEQTVDKAHAETLELYDFTSVHCKIAGFTFVIDWTVVNGKLYADVEPLVD